MPCSETMEKLKRNYTPLIALFFSAAFPLSAASAQTAAPKPPTHHTPVHRTTTASTQPLPAPVVPKTVPAVTGPIK